MSSGNYDIFVSTVVDKPGSVEATRDSVLKGSYVYVILYDVGPRVPEVPDSVGCARLRLLGVASGGKGGLSAILCERRGKGFYSSTMTD